MSALAAYARANELYIDEEFEQAAPFYDQAIQLEANVAKYYLNRAANRLKLRDYMEVLPDVERALELEPASSLAWFRKGLAYFSLSEFESALGAFESAHKMGFKKCDVWIRKCQAEIRKESSDRPVVFTEGKPAVEASASKPLTEEKKPVEEKPKKPVEEKPKKTEEIVEDKPPETLASKVKPNWTQNLNSVQITLFAKNLTQNDVAVTINNRELRARLALPDGSMFDKIWNLYAPVQEEHMRVKVNAFKVEIALDKTVAGDWRGLEADAKPEGVTVRQNQVAEGRVPAPYTSKKDWNEVEQTVKQEEQAEKPEGNEALQKLFQQIYADGDPEVRRAMMKSYQTSGGTVLSTNWGDVAKKDYEKEGITAPKGQEVRKWNE